MKLRLFIAALGIAGLVASAGLFAGDGGDMGQTTHTSYYANGQAKETAEYQDGSRYGRCQRWYDSGQLRAEGEFVSGQMNGEWSWFTPDGQRDESRSGVYERGRRVGS